MNSKAKSKLAAAGAVAIGFGVALSWAVPGMCVVGSSLILVGVILLVLNSVSM